MVADGRGAAAARWRGLAALALVSALAGTVAACGGGAGGGDSAGGASTGGKTVKVAYVGPVTGALAAAGTGGLNGAKAGVAYLNGGGSVAGVKYQLVIRDDQGDPTKSAAAVRELGAQHVTMVMPTATPGSDVAVQPFINQSHMLYVSPATAGLTGEMSANGKYPWVFGTGPSYAQYSVKQIEYVAKTLGVKELGQIYSADPGGKAFAASAAGYAKPLGVKLVSQSFAPTQQDVTAQLTKLKNAGAQALAIWTFGTPLVTVAQSLSKMNWRPPIVTVLGSADPAVVGLLKKASPDVLKHMLGGPVATAYTSDKPGAAPSGALAKAFTENMRKVTGKPLTGNDLVGAYTFDALIALDRGIKAAGSTDTKKIADVFSTKPIQISQGTTPWPKDRGSGVPNDELGLLQSDSDFSNGTGLAPQPNQ